MQFLRSFSKHEFQNPIADRIVKLAKVELVNKDGSDVMLFNLKEDINETRNFKNEYPQITNELKKEALAWRDSLPEYINVK